MILVCAPDEQLFIRGRSVAITRLLTMLRLESLVSFGVADGAVIMSKEIVSGEPPLELEIPEGVSVAERSVEVIRAWIADGALMVSLNADAFGDSAATWGRLLSEIAGHAGRALALQGLMNQGEAEAAVRQAFTASALIQPGERAARTSEGKLKGHMKH